MGLIKEMIERREKNEKKKEREPSDNMAADEVNSVAAGDSQFVWRFSRNA